MNAMEVAADRGAAARPMRTTPQCRLGLSPGYDAASAYEAAARSGNRWMPRPSGKPMLVRDLRL